jgi:hypothetical protein
VRERLARYRDAKVDTLRVEPAGKTLAERIATLGRLRDLMRAL